MIRRLNHLTRLDVGLDSETDAVVIRRLDHLTRLDVGLDSETGAVVIARARSAIEASRLDAGGDLDARVLRRRLHGGVPFSFVVVLLLDHVPRSTSWKEFRDAIARRNMPARRG